MSEPREADQRIDLPGLQGLGADEGIGPCLTGADLLADPWIVRAIRLLEEPKDEERV